MKRTKRKTVWAYLDGKKLVDVVQAALDNNMMVDDKAVHKGQGFRGQGGFAEAVFGGFLHNQAVGFRRRLELLVVVGARSGSVLLGLSGRQEAGGRGASGP